MQRLNLTKETRNSKATDMGNETRDHRTTKVWGPTIEQPRVGNEMQSPREAGLGGTKCGTPFGWFWQRSGGTQKRPDMGNKKGSPRALHRWGKKTQNPRTTGDGEISG